MSFFKKLKERMFRSSDKIGEGLEALVAEGVEGSEDLVPDLPEALGPEVAEVLQPDRPDVSEPSIPEMQQPQVPEPAMPRSGVPTSDRPMRVLVPEPAEAEETARPGLLGRLFGRAAVEEPRRVLDDEMLESLEELLIQADMGVDTAVRVTANIVEGRFGRKVSTRELRSALAAEVARIMEPVARPMPLYPQKPQVVLVVGVNGSGKTTTIGKLASQFKAAGKTVVIAAGDTFRAAAVEQLQIWGQRAGVPVLTAPEGSDPASLAFDALTKARADGADLLMIDTAGRLQNRQDLMEELAKIVRVIRKVDPTAPHNTLLVLDATTGQNAVAQVDIFRKIADVSGLVMTKLDGTAKGGVLVALADKFGLPIHAIGVGEQIDDLAPFDPEEFARALVGAEGVIRSGLLVLALAVPAGAEELAMCQAAWAKVGAGLETVGAVTDSGVLQDGDWCVVERPTVDVEGQYLPDWHVDRLRFRGAALGWLVDGSVTPDGLEVAVEGLRLVVETGNAQMDWLFAAQSRPNAINGELAMAWDADARTLQLEGLSVDFPGDNEVHASGVVTGVDLSSTGAMQMSATSFALTELDLRVTTHGLFEWYALMALGSAVLPIDGDMEAAATAIRADLVAMVADLPETSVSADSKAALGTLIGELPNPAGELELALRAEPGIGPVRVGGYAITGVPKTIAEAAPIFQGVTIDVDWTHTDAP